MSAQQVTYTVKNSCGTMATIEDLSNFFSDGRYEEMKAKKCTDEFIYNVYCIDIQMALLPGPFAHTVKPEMKMRIAERFYLTQE